MDILFSEGSMPLNWNNVLQEIRGDFENFVKNGSWGFLREEASVQEQSESGDGDSDFQDDSGPSSEDEDISEEDEASSSFSGGDHTESEEGLEWDELDKKAAEHDKKQALRFQDNEKRRR